MTSNGKVLIWDAEDQAMRLSRETYSQLSDSIRYDEEVGDYYRSIESQKITGYIHGRTGLITTDVGKFEAWLERVER